MRLFRRKRDDQPVDLEDRSELGVKYKDLLVLDQLRKAGADLRQPRHVLHYLYFPTQERAERAGEEAGAASYEVEVRDPLPDHSNQWLLLCQRHGVVVDPATVSHSTDYFESLAQTHFGDYDGWEASV